MKLGAGGGRGPDVAVNGDDVLQLRSARTFPAPRYLISQQTCKVTVTLTPQIGHAEAEK